MNYKKIGQYIKEKRKNIGLTQSELGDKLGVTSKAVSKWECGVALPDVSLFSEISEILKIDISELLSGSDKNISNNSEIIKKKNRNKKIIIICLSILSCILFISSLLLGIMYFNFKSNSKEYNLISENEEFKVDGKLLYINGKCYIIINEVKYLEDNKNIIHGSNLEYELYYNYDKLIYRSSINYKNSFLPFNKILSFVKIIKQDDNIKINNVKNEMLTLKISLLNISGNIKKYTIQITVK